MLPLCMIASALSASAVVIMAAVLPAGRIKTIAVLFGLLLILALLFTFRLLRPERLVNPDTFATLVLYLRDMATPGSPFLPSTWTCDALLAALVGEGTEALFHLSLAWNGAMALFFIATSLSTRLYFRGYSQAQIAKERLLPDHNERSWVLDRLHKRFSGAVWALAAKDIKTFFRDQTQWPQLFLIAALITIYLYNFSVLPLDRSQMKTIYLQNIFSFLNMGLALFVLTAVAARFVYPAVSLEGDAFWIVQAAPLSMRTFLWVKFCVYYLPLLILAEFLIATSNLLLQVTPFMMILSVMTVFVMVPGVVAMAIGLGAAYRDFKSENPAQAVTSFGGLLFMLCSAGFVVVVIVLEAGPVYRLFMSELHGRALDRIEWLWIGAAFGLVFLLCLAAVIGPMRWGEKQLHRSAGDPVRHWSHRIGKGRRKGPRISMHQEGGFSPSDPII